jgi:rubrerythrin
MPSTKKIEEGEKDEVIGLLRSQIVLEEELVSLYEKTAGSFESGPVRHLLHMIQLDSRKHIDICQTTMEVLGGEDVLKPEKKELIGKLGRHIELEKDSINRVNKILKNVWIRENKGLNELIKKLRKDENEHHNALRRLAGKEFFRVVDGDLYGIFRDPEERYVKYEMKKKKEKTSGKEKK